MKNLNASVFLFFILLSMSKAQIPNGDFTNWHSDSLGRLDPDLWDCSNLMYDSATVLQDLDRSGGPGYSIKFISIFDSSANRYRSGSATILNVPFSGNNPTTIKGFWKNNNSSSDLFDGEVIFYDSSNSMIGHVIFEAPLTGSINNWTSFSKNISYTSNNPVTSYDIDIILTNLSHSSGLYFLLDDLSFDVFTDINDMTSQNENLKCKILSQSDDYRLVVSSRTQDKINVSIKDVIGRTISELGNGNNNSSDQEFDLNMSSLPKGIYFCCVNTVSEKKVIRIFK